jgi:hypothetical protein
MGCQVRFLIVAVVTFCALLLTKSQSCSQTFSRAPIWQHEILPVLKKNCIQCHGGEETIADLDLTSFEKVLKGGVRGPMISPGHPEMSLLWDLIENDEMPKNRNLSSAEKQLIKGWIEYGRFPSKETLDANRKSSLSTEYAVIHSDIHATIFHLLGFDHKKLTFKYEGRDESLVGVNTVRVLNEIIE